jgi:hypothetical protein
VQTVAMYHSLIPRILYGNISAQAALQACEEEFFQSEGLLEGDIDDEYSEEDEVVEETIVNPPPPPELTVQDVMAEVTRLLEDRKES